MAPVNSEALTAFTDSGDDADSASVTYHRLAGDLSPAMGVAGDIYQSPPIGVGGDLFTAVDA